MRRRLLLSAFLIAALVGAVAGGTLGSFSDIETSEDNVFDTVGMDLKVSFGGFEYDDPDVPAVYENSIGWPECSKDRCWDIHNAGSGEQCAPIAYLHFKNLNCTWTTPKTVYKWIECDEDTGECNPADKDTPGARPVTEPEYVAECGGIAGEDVNGNFIPVPGLGCGFGDGDGCELTEHTAVTIRVAGPYAEDELPVDCDAVPDPEWRGLDLTEYDKNNDGVVRFNEIECEQIEIGPLPGCHTYYIDMSLKLKDIPEEWMFTYGGLERPGTGYGYFDESILAELKWDHWPTNALMYDTFEFDISHELLSVPCPPTP